MSKSLIRGSLSLLKWVLCARRRAGAGAAGACSPRRCSRLPELHSISRARATVDLSSLPAVERFQARDGTWLGFRHYARGRHADRPRGDRGSRLLRLQRRHHPCAVAGAGRARRRDLCGRYARPRRVRHARRYRLCRPARGRSRRFRRGVAQDRAVGAADPGRPFRRRRLCAAGGGLADPEPVRAHRAARALSRLRCADHPAEFRRLGAAPISRASSACWRCAQIGINCCEALPVLAFAVPPNSEKTLVSTYTDRLMRNFAVQRRFPPRSRRRDKAAHDHRRRRRRIDAGGQICRSRAWRRSVAVDVKLIDGINHMGIVAAPKAVSIVAEDVATRAMAGS